MTKSHFFTAAMEKQMDVYFNMLPMLSKKGMKLLWFAQRTQMSSSCLWNFRTNYISTHLFQRYSTEAQKRLLDIKKVSTTLIGNDDCKAVIGMHVHVHWLWCNPYFYLQVKYWQRPEVANQEQAVSKHLLHLGMYIMGTFTWSNGEAGNFYSSNLHSQGTNI